MKKQTYVATDQMRLEVETTSTGLTNMVVNPNGELGGWGWITPVSGSLMQGGKNLDLIHGSGTYELIYSNPSGTVASYFYTEPMAVSAGQYVGARWYETYTSGVWIRARFEWLNSGGSVISSSTQTGYFGSGTNVVSATVAPATTTAVRLRFDVYANTSGTNPTGGHIHLKNVTVAKAATAGAIGYTRTNLVKNPSFETNISGWENRTNATSLTRVTGGATPGTYALRATAVGSGDMLVQQTATGTSAMPCTPGTDVYANFKMWATVTKNMTGGFGFWKADGTPLAGYTFGLGNNTPSAWSQRAFGYTAPSDAAFFRVYIGVNGALAGEQYLFDQIIVENAASLPDYFDGDTTDAGGVTYDWTGTAGASTSTASAGFLAYIEPITYQNILGPSKEITIDRGGLNVGIMQATILDANLDPSKYDLIRPGKRVRLVVKSGTEWEPIFTGRISNGKAEYDYWDKTTKNTKVTMTAVDNISVLTQHKRPQGVGSISYLPWVLEGAGTPWNVNGSGNQLAVDPTVVSTNDNASALDQVAVTRDSQLGSAWVDRKNVLNVWNTAPDTVIATLTDADINDVQAEYDSDRVINTVTYKYLTYDIATGETTETPYGPYVDQTSIDAYGPHVAEFTVHGAGFDFSAHSAAILAANATPQKTVRSATMRIATTGDTTSYALLDLYDIVTIDSTLADIDIDQRVGSITHTISGDKWMMTIGFDSPTGVAQPQSYPPVQNSTGAPEPGSVISRNDAAPMSQGFTTGSPGFNNTVHSATGWVVPAYAKRALVSFSAGARCGANAALFWSCHYQTVAEGYVQIAVIREHNTADAYYNARVNHTAMINVTPGTAINFYINCAVDIGSGSFFDFHPGNCHVDWIA